MDRTCPKCGKVFTKPCLLKNHLARKTPCDPILDPSLAESEELTNVCKYCGRSFTTKTSMYRHIRQRCKIANTEEGMDKLMDHTLQRQMAEMRAQLTELTSLLKGQARIPAGLTLAGPTHQHAEGKATIVNGDVQQTVQQTVQQIHIDKVEIRPWDGARAVDVSVAQMLAAFAENTKLQEYARLPDHSMTDLEIAPPYVAELFTDLVRRSHADPASRNIYLNPRRADQVLVHLTGGTWEVRTALDGYRALLDGVAASVHEVTLAYEKRKLLPLEAQNALAMAGLLYDDEPEAYVERAKGSLAAHLANLAPAPSK